VGAFATAFRAPGLRRVAVGPRIGRARIVAGRYRVGVRARNATGQASPWRAAIVTVRG